MNASDPARLGLWGLANRLLMGLIVLALLAAAALSYLPLIRQNQKMRQELEIKRGGLEKLEGELRTVQAAITAQQRDPRAVERAAREQGLGRPGEIILKFEPSAR